MGLLGRYSGEERRRWRDHSASCPALAASRCSRRDSTHHGNSVRGVSGVRGARHSEFGLHLFDPRRPGTRSAADRLTRSRQIGLTMTASPAVIDPGAQHRRVPATRPGVEVVVHAARSHRRRTTARSSGTARRVHSAAADVADVDDRPAVERRPVDARDGDVLAGVARRAIGWPAAAKPSITSWLQRHSACHGRPWCSPGRLHVAVDAADADRRRADRRSSGRHHPMR